MTALQHLSALKWSRNILSIVMIGMLFFTSSAFANMQGETTNPLKQLSANGIKSQLPELDAQAIRLAPSNTIQDPSFEASYNSTIYWDQYSHNFGTPLCITEDCGGGIGTTAAPRTGSVWAWFGGVDFTDPSVLNPEGATVSQSVNIPSCGATLQFYFWIGSAQAGSDTEDFFGVWLGDDTKIFWADATEKSLYPSYTLVTVNINPGTFTPGQNILIFGSMVSDQHVNFNLDDVSLIPNCPTISGNAGVGGAVLKYTGGSATADSNGDYWFEVASGWSGTVTPSKNGYTFLPTSRTYTNVTTSQVAQNYTVMLNTHTISGNTGIPDVELSYNNGIPQTVYSEMDGSYSFQVPHGWSGTVTPSKPNHIFSPISRTYTNVTANQPAQNYTATVLYSISGDAGAAGVTLSYTIGTPKTVISQADGSYSFVVPSGWSGMVTPSKSGYIFSPANRTYTNVTANQTDHNYTAIPLYTISGNVGAANVTLSYIDGTVKTVTSQADGSYSLIVSGGWNGTVTPTHACFTFIPVGRTYTNVASHLVSQNYLSAFNFGAGCADVDVLIGRTYQGRFGLLAGGSTRASFVGINNGPVQIVSSNERPIIGAERLIYKVNGVNTSFTEMMALPNAQLDTTYWLPWYNNKDLDTQLRFANISGATATVHVYVHGVEMTGSPFTLAAGESTRKSFPGVNDGPVKIVSDQNIVAAERLIYKVNGVNTSFSEMMALPNSQLDKIYWLPWYNNKDLDTQLRFANVTDQTATVQVFIGGQEMPGSPFTLLAGESTRVSFTGINNGPVKIVSDHNIVAAERLIYKVSSVATSFSEMMALPNNQLDTTYWLPWYNNKDLDTQLRFANTTDQTATVHIFIGGTEITPASGMTLLAGQSTRVSFIGVNNGPVRIVSDQKIVAAERLIYKVNGVNTSFSEMVGLPDHQLDTTYWLPWYNNVDLDTQLRFGTP